MKAWHPLDRVEELAYFHMQHSLFLVFYVLILIVEHDKKMCCFLLNALEFEIKEESVLLGDIQSLLSFLTSAGNILNFPC